VCYGKGMKETNAPMTETRKADFEFNFLAKAMEKVVMHENELLVYKVVPAVGLAPIWKSIKAWLYIYTLDGVQCKLETPYRSEESARVAGELYVSKNGNYGPFSINPMREEAV